jgi:multimeric flavodoxin WrbA
MNLQSLSNDQIIGSFIQHPFSQEGIILKAVILDASISAGTIETSIVRLIESEFQNSGHAFTTFTLRDMNILPCRSCGACGFKSPGVCVQQDDAPGIIRAVANCSLLVMVTPLNFGGYPSQLKKALDRFMILGLTLYMVKSGHLLHPMRYTPPSVFAVGLARDEAECKDNILELLVSRNAMNLGSPRHKALVFDRSVYSEPAANEIKRALSEVMGQ